MSSDELQEIRVTFQGLRTLYQTYLPKVDPILIDDLLVREQEKGKKSTSASSSSSPFYIVEISTLKGTDPEKMKNMIFGKTGLLPTISESGTRYIANMRLTLELLWSISNFEEGIVRITGDYTGGIAGR